ncbi:MAG: MoxR family ATPase [Candidatus Abyssobacteria bacterium SURF_17]|uniref:MoxR family ATPase n=1 Tax=Candidatus Abyssobacteria bacterium SURF_17 TaxID=2093361 RepID=A0A419EU00_9BACT|nr:MAG: MoxR family ATPase [Candidatus Abyssubacteria bacterium SURF_17]
MSGDIQVITQRVKEQSKFVRTLVSEMGKVIVGQKYMVERLLVGLLSNGHILLEGVPGLAKTTAVRVLSECINTKFQRIQFTPDLLPADLVGTQVYNPKDGQFTVKRGPIFANLILADEINRAPAKVQSALLEAMQERQVTIGENTFKLTEPFLVLATQNPIEQEGTYPLPEAQVDRFMLKLKITYPNKQEEREIMDRVVVGADFHLDSVVTPTDILDAREVVNAVYIDEKIKDYIVNIVFATREPKSFGMPGLDGLIEYGASPRASIYLSQTAKAYAFVQGRGYVTPQDVKTIGMDVLRHRVILSYEAEAEEMTPEDVIQKIFDHVEVP